MHGFCRTHKNSVINTFYALLFYLFLGWTGEKVLLVGDSAGGNLIVSLTLRLIELNAARLPDGLIPIYTPFLFQVTRVFCLKFHLF
jgi:acetyl esterase/lipase